MPEYQSDYSRETFPIPLSPDKPDVISEIWRDTFKDHVQLLTSDGSVIGVAADTTPTIDPRLEQEFYTLAEQWRSETRHLSIAKDKACSFALHQIIGMGERALPLILKELQTKTTDWFWTLRAIARDRAPVIPEEDQGVVRRIADIWIQWGKDNGYLRS